MSTNPMHDVLGYEGTRTTRTRQRERYDDGASAPSRRPAYMRDNYVSTDSGPLVLQERNNLDTRIRNHRTRSPIPLGQPREWEMRIGRDRSPSPPRDRNFNTRPPIIRYPERQHIDEVIWDLSRSKDTTVHLELDIAEDLEADLEEFSRLGRLGRFHAAKIYFRDNLEHQLDNPYVLVQYAHMLAEMGDYGGIDSLRIPDNLKDYWELRTNWNLINLELRYSTGSLTEDGERHARKNILPLDHISRPQELDSTQCQILSLSLRFFNGVPENDFGHLEWAIIYTMLYRQGRFWDFVDLFLPAVSYFGLEHACRRFFNEDFNSIDLLDGLFNDWAMSRYDEITNFAILEIATTLTLEEMSPKNLPALKKYMKKAGTLAQSLIQHSPSNLKTRQYIRWILAKVTVDNSKESIRPWSDITAKLPGYDIRTSYALDLPIYIPISKEFPTWQVSNLVSGSIKILQTALEASKQLGDYKTQALCLKFLILHSEDPLKLYDELVHLQKSVQKDIVGWLMTCISKYIICRDKESQDNLRDELLSMDKSLNFSVDWKWGRLMILRALAHSDEEASDLLQEASVSLNLSKAIMKFMTSNDLIKIVTAGEPSTKEKTRENPPLSDGEAKETKTPADTETKANIELEVKISTNDVHEGSSVPGKSEKNGQSSAKKTPEDEDLASAKNEISPCSNGHRSSKNGVQKFDQPTYTGSDLEPEDRNDTSNSRSPSPNPNIPERQLEDQPSELTNNVSRNEKTEGKVTEPYPSESEEEDIGSAHSYLDDDGNHTYRRGSGGFYQRDASSLEDKDHIDVERETRPKQDHYEYEDPPQVRVPIYGDGPECEEVNSIGDMDGDKENVSSHTSPKESNSGKSPTSKRFAARVTTAEEEGYRESGW